MIIVLCPIWASYTVEVKVDSKFLRELLKTNTFNDNNKVFQNLGKRLVVPNKGAIYINAQTIKFRIGILQKKV